MQRGAGDRGALHEDGFQLGHGREHAGPPNLHGDVLEQSFGGRDPRNGLVDNGVAGGTRLGRDALRIGKAVELEHNAIDLVRQLAAQVARLVVAANNFLAVNAEHFLDAVADPVLLRGETEPRECLEHLVVRRELNSLTRADRVEHRADGPLRHELRVELLERTSGCVAGIGKSFLPSCRELRVHGFEIFRGDVSLTTHFQQRWRILQMQF